MQMSKHLDQELSDYAREQLKGKKRAKVERHLDSCLACSAQLTEVRQLVNTLSVRPKDKQTVFRVFVN
jgi:anti-sigma factor RsiW